jgi:hypothetical protein
MKAGDPIASHRACNGLQDNLQPVDLSFGAHKPDTDASFFHFRHGWEQENLQYDARWEYDENVYYNTADSEM